ncbi:MAG TPA: hypothetical protein VJP60_02915 [Rhizomicrobium sp.]|nr:hypothetical protein [Rhizomicrobium sp.]
MREWIMAAATLLLAGGAAQAEDCALRQIASIPMEVYPDHLLLPVSFGAVPEKLVFRMEDASSGISGDVADKLGFPVTSIPPNVHFKRGGGDIEHLAHARDMHLGRLTINEMDFQKLKPGSYRDGVAGDLGTQMFEQVDLELDIAGGKFNLFASDHCPGEAVYWTQDYVQVPLKPAKYLGYLRAELKLDGQPLTVSFSTEGRSHIGMNAMRRLFNIDQTSPQLTAVGQDLLGHKTYRFPFKALTVDGLTVNNPDFLVYDEAPRPECRETPHFDLERTVHSTEQPHLMHNFSCTDAVLGLSVLSKLRLYVSRKENLLYVSAAGAK